MRDCMAVAPEDLGLSLQSLTYCIKMDNSNYLICKAEIAKLLCKKIQCQFQIKGLASSQFSSLNQN